MRCLILGGNGFLGRHLCLKLSRNNNVTVFDRHLPPASEFVSSVKYVSGDFGNVENIEDVMKACDVVFHLISTTVPKSSNDDPMSDVHDNVLPTIRMLSLAVKHKIKKVIFSSSGGTVYGIPESVPVNESHSTNPTCSYGICKLTIEKYLYLYSKLYGLDYMVLRISNLYGEGQSLGVEQGVIGTLINRVKTNSELEIWGDGEIVRDYIYIADVVSAFNQALYYTGPFKVFNIGSGVGVSINSVITAIESLIMKDVLKTYVDGRVLDVPVNILDNTLSKRELDWDVAYSLERGLEKTLINSGLIKK